MSDLDQLSAINTNAALPQGFQHDNEHPQLQLPFTARIGERRMEGQGLAVTHAIVSGLLPPNVEKRAHPVAFRFDFEGYSVNLFIDASVEKFGGPDSAEYRLRFTDPTGAHLAPLRYILNSYIAGDVISIGRMLGYNGPTQVKHAKPKAPPTLGQQVGTWSRKGFLALASLALVALAATVIHERVVYSYEPRPVTITQVGETLRATAPGQVTFVNPEAEVGEVLYAIAANTGDFLSVKMPCDCDVVTFEGFFEGATILPGVPLVKLIGEDAALDARAEVTFEGVARAFAGDAAELVLPGERVVPVHVTLTESEAETPGSMVAELRFAEGDATQVQPGESARLRFRRQILPAWIAGRAPGLDQSQ